MCKDRPKKVQNGVWADWRSNKQVREEAGLTALERFKARSGNLAFIQNVKQTPNTLKVLRQGCEKAGVCFRNLIFLVLCMWHEKGPGGGQGDQRGNSYRNSGDRGMFI